MVTVVDAARGLRQCPGALRRTPRALLSASVATGEELVWLAAHAITYPAGLLAENVDLHDPRYRIDTLPPLTRGLITEDINAAGRPILLVHGIGDNRSAFSVLRRTLRRRGYGRISTVNYSPLTSDIRRAAADFERHVERTCALTGYDQVFVVGHSLGGIIARYYVQCRGGDERVHTLVTLGSPHSGTHLARLAPLVRVARQLAPGSELMRELAAPAPYCTTRFVAVHSDRDEVVLPNRSARLDHPDLSVTRLAVHGVGHLALLVNGAVMHAVAGALAPLSTAAEAAEASPAC
ncbi:MAG TPA: alpha/beta fold hydrolase [Jatrophihabitans sp.]|nr:alpha/beta fold hydrolase [Jatrophihabitans sp.]